MIKYKYILILLAISINVDAYSKLQIDLEAGPNFVGYNDVGIPGNTGTRFSLTDDLNTNTGFYYRARIGYTFSERHTVSFLYSPLLLKATGRANKNINFQGKTFNAGTDLTAEFKFNSYRLTYRYDFVKSKSWIFGLGFTAKIRDAYTSLENSSGKEIKKNVGFVPLLNLYLQWNFLDDFSLLLEGDGLVAPQGRAEDFFLGLLYDINNNLTLKTGYRILEGGADNDNVYTFTLIHYIAVGVIIKI